MRKVALALALLFCADVALDSFDSSCIQEASCHACLCQTHVLTSPSSTSERIEAPKPTFVASALDLFADRLIDKTIFRPPIVLA